MDDTRKEGEQRIEIAELKAVIVNLRARAVEDSKNAEAKLHMEIHLASHEDVVALQDEITSLRAKLAADDLVIDRLVVIMRRRVEDDAALLEGTL